jgi:hypothetical protein
VASGPNSCSSRRMGKLLPNPAFDVPRTGPMVES